MGRGDEFSGVGSLAALRGPRPARIVGFVQGSILCSDPALALACAFFPEASALCCMTVASRFATLRRASDPFAGALQPMADIRCGYAPAGALERRNAFSAPRDPCASCRD